MSDSPNLLTRRNLLRFTTGLGIAVAFEQLVPAYAQLAGIQSGDQANADVNTWSSELNGSISNG
jgi:hypothetical protein